MNERQRRDRIEEIRRFPQTLEALVVGLDAEKLTAPLLDGEWTVARNVHHLVDSHINSYVRCKLIATEEKPTLRPYDEKAWALLPDASSADLSDSLALLGALHRRWAQFWENLSDEEWERQGVHPEGGVVTLDEQLRLYVEHGRAHLEQIRRTLAAA